MLKITLPEWTNNLPDSALLIQKDLVGFFGRKNIADQVAKGKIPPHESIHYAGVRHRKQLHWTLGALRELYRRQNEE